MRRFDADVHQLDLIGPIFAAHIADWPAHLETISEFRSNVTGGPLRFSGPYRSNTCRWAIDRPGNTAT